MVPMQTEIASGRAVTQTSRGHNRWDSVGTGAHPTKAYASAGTCRHKSHPPDRVAM